MFLLGHLGIGLGLAWLLSWKSPTRIDYRWVLFGAILPDLIDKPLGFLAGLDSRLWAHTFLLLFAILALGFVPSPRRLPLRRWPRGAIRSPLAAQLDDDFLPRLRDEDLLVSSELEAALDVRRNPQDRPAPTPR